MKLTSCSKRRDLFDFCVDIESFKKMSGIHSADGNDYAIALRRKVDFVGKRNKKSKVCVFWAFQSRRGSKFRHEVRRRRFYFFLIPEDLYKNNQRHHR